MRYNRQLDRPYRPPVQDHNQREGSDSANAIQRPCHTHGQGITPHQIATRESALMREHYKPLLGEISGRTPISLGGLPSGVEAVTVPVRRDGESRVPRDRRGRTNVRRVDLVAAKRVPLFEPPPGLSRADLVWTLSAGRRLWSSVRSRFGDRAFEVGVELVRSGAVILRCAVDRDRLALGSPENWSLSCAWVEQA